MTLTKRIIACLDVNAGRVVKGVQFVDIVDAGDPAELARRHAEAGTDEIVLLDITATHEGRGTLIDAVKRTAEQLFIPFTVGGGIRTVEDAAAIFDAGADKVSINSAAIARPELIEEIGKRFGAQAVVVAIDARRAHGATQPVIDAEVFVSGGRKPTGRKALDWAKEAESRGAGEILLTSMDADGTRTGFDCELTSRVSDVVHIPVIASGGAGTADHFADVLLNGKADAALAASIFHFGIANVRELKEAIARRGVPGEIAMLIPSIDLMGGRIVQLVQGEKLKLAFDDFEYWIERFSNYPLVQLIDLDAAMRQGDNAALIEKITSRLPCQVGGGIATVERARQILDCGARRVIFGSALFRSEDSASAVNISLARLLQEGIGTEQFVASIDTKKGQVAIKGWKEQAGLTPQEALEALNPFCTAFLYTHVDTEGTMTGFPIEIAHKLRGLTDRQLIVAGGIREQAEIDTLHQMGIDTVAGMAIYTGAIAT